MSDTPWLISLTLVLSVIGCGPDAGTPTDASVGHDGDAQQLDGSSTDAQSNTSVDLWVSDGSTDAMDPSDGATPLDPFAPSLGSTMTLGIASSCAITPNHQVKCWGSATAGGIGLPVTPACTGACGPLVATTVPGITDATGISIGAFNRLLFYRTSTGQAYLYAATPTLLATNATGISVTVDPHQVFVATTTQVLAMSPITSPPTPLTSSVFAYPLRLGGGQQTCAVVLSSGKVACWNTDGIVSEAIGVTGAAQIDAGGGVYCAALTNGHVRCWGGAYGASPGVDVGLTNAVQVSSPLINDALSLGTCAVTSMGTVSCWTPSATPTLSNVAGVTDVVEVALGASHACARTSTGAIYCWGQNLYGQLGTGATGADATVPVSVVGF